MTKTHFHNRRSKNIVGAVCCLLFLGFSFTYLYILHDDLVGSLYDSLSAGRKVYSPLWGALLITSILWMLQWGLGKLTRFVHLPLAFSYFPAYWALAFLTCVCPTGADGAVNTSAWRWHGLWWLFPVALIAYFVIGLMSRRWMRMAGRRSLSQSPVSNLVILILYSYATGLIGNDNELLHNKLTVSRYLREQRYEEALLVGKKSLHNAPSLTAMRVWALAHTGALGQSLFEYPQHNRAEGLFFQEGTCDVCTFTDKDIGRCLGGVSRKENESAVSYLQRICDSDSVSRIALDYYLCALLLEKRLPDFHQVLLRHWSVNEALPRHYQEALLIHQESADDVSPFAPLCLPSVGERYDAFKQLQGEYELPLHKNNYTHRKFGDTYWWYYWYGG